MAWENLQWVWYVIGIQGSEYVVLMALSNEADINGLTPLVPVEKICRRCNLNRRGVFYYLKRLEAKGFIERKEKFKPSDSRSRDASAYQLDKTRFFPKGKDYSESFAAWKKILAELDAIVKRAELDKRRDFERPRKPRVDIADLQTLHAQIENAVLQKNTRTLYLVSSGHNDVVNAAMFACLGPLKEAAVTLNLRIRRFEIFKKPDYR